MKKLFKRHDSGWLMPLIGVLAVLLIALWALGNKAPAGGTTSDATGAAQQATSQPAKKIPTTSKTSTDVAGVAKGISNASIFASWLSSTGVAAELTGKGPYTLFVPTDAAIALLPSGTFRNLSAVEKKRFVEYYVIPDRMINADAQISGTVWTMSGDPLNFTKGAGQATLVGPAIILAQYKAENGVVYVINSALVPPQKPR